MCVSACPFDDDHCDDVVWQVGSALCNQATMRLKICPRQISGTVSLQGS